MSRTTEPPWLPEAQQRRKDGESYAAIARALHASPASVRLWLDPEARARQAEYRRRWRQTESGKRSTAADNAKRKAAKLEHQRHAPGAICENCGAERPGGSAWPSKHGLTGLCRKCVDDKRKEQANEKRREIERLWNEGLPGREIAERVGISYGVLRRTISDMRSNGGWNVPHRYRLRSNDG